MKSKLLQAVLGGMAATLVMTIVMFIGPFMGLPKMNPAAMLSMMMGFPLFAGWIMHFMIGIIFALAYVFLFVPIVKKLNSRVMKGMIFGLAVFVFAQIMMAIMGAIFGEAPSPGGSMVLTIVGSIMGHIIYGIVVVLFVRNE
jgi:uncharacterized membrane protein YagU involved in acid resistance